MIKMNIIKISNLPPGSFPYLAFLRFGNTHFRISPRSGEIPPYYCENSENSAPAQATRWDRISQNAILSEFLRP